MLSCNLIDVRRSYAMKTLDEETRNAVLLQEVQGMQQCRYLRVPQSTVTGSNVPWLYVNINDEGQDDVHGQQEQLHTQEQQEQQNQQEEDDQQNGRRKLSRRDSKCYLWQNYKSFDNGDEKDDVQGSGEPCARERVSRLDVPAPLSNVAEEKRPVIPGGRRARLPRIVITLH